MTTSRIYAYRWPARLVSHKPFAAERYSITSSCIWQVFFRKKNEFSFLFSLFCQRAHFLCKMHNPLAFCGWKTPPPRVCWDSMGGKGGGYTYYVRRPLPSAPAGRATSSPSQSPTVTDSPFCRCATSSPGAGEVFPQRESPWHGGAVSGLSAKLAGALAPPGGAVERSETEGL